VTAIRCESPDRSLTGPEQILARSDDRVNAIPIVDVRRQFAVDRPTEPVHASLLCPPEDLIRRRIPFPVVASVLQAAGIQTCVDEGNLPLR
jgi:hypothetical protein